MGTVTPKYTDVYLDVGLYIMDVIANYLVINESFRNWVFKSQPEGSSAYLKPHPI